MARRRHRLSVPALLVGLVVVIVVSALAIANGGGTGARRSNDALVVLDAPASTQPWIAAFMREGAELAVKQINATGGMATAAGKRHIQLKVLDNGSSPARALANARRAVEDGAILLLTDGTGAQAVAGVTDPARLPTIICFNGGAELIDPAQHPTLFRLAPENKAMARRLADYVANSRPQIGIISDDSEYGRQGRAELIRAFAFDDVDVVADQRVPTAASNVAPQVLAARTAGADRLVVWTRSTNVAATVQAVRSSGWNVPIFVGPTGEDPLVRQRLATHREWVNGLVFVSFRITSEIGPKPYDAFRKEFEAAYGPQRIGVLEGGKPVVQPPDWAMFTYDAIKLSTAALAQAQPTAAELLAGLQRTVITGANGDERGYEPTQHEGVNPSDVYFARFKGFVFVPVTDDPLSGTLSAVSQLAG